MYSPWLVDKESVVPWQSNAFPADSVMVSPVYTSATAGWEGTPLPNLLRSDAIVTCLLLACFLLLVVLLKNNRKYIFQYIKDSFRQKERTSMFDAVSETDRSFLVVLPVIVCVLSGIGLYKYFCSTDVILCLQIPSQLLLGIYIVCALVYIPIKWGCYGFLNWIFFDKEKNRIWLQTYFGVISGVCFLLFPTLLLIVYQNLPVQTSLHLMLMVLLIAKIQLLYRCIRNFFNQIYGFLHFIVYFCALEVIPLILFWKVINYINNILIFKLLGH